MERSANTKDFYRRGMVALGIVLVAMAGLAVAGWLFYRFHAVGPEPAPVVSASSSTSMSSPAAATTTTTIAHTPTSTQGGAVRSNPPYVTVSSSASIAPASGPVGMTVTITGSGFAPTGNTVLFNDLTSSAMNGIPSPDGTTLTFTVPGELGPYCKPRQLCAQFLMMVGLNDTYAVTVISNGVTQNAGTFTVTGGAPSNHFQ